MVRTAWLRRAATYMVTATMTCFGLTSVASAQTITNTGPGSTNTISSNSTDNCTVTNTNNVSAHNYNQQSATTGGVTEVGNTTAGLPWTGWSTLDPTAAQANGQSYSSWWSSVVNWISQRASGTGWNSSSSNLTWAPTGSSWSSFDPATWQANGQSFGNWYNAVEAYLNSQSSNWILTWPADATGGGSFGAMSGSATNNYNASFSITINNAASTLAGTNSCGQSNFTPPPMSGGKGSGGGVSALTASSPSTSHTPSLSSGSGGGSGGGGGSFGSSHTAPRVGGATVATTSSPTSATCTTPSGGSGGGSTPAPTSTISNTGPGSHNTIASNYTDNSSVTNNNTVVVSSFSNQSASSGASTSYDNTSVGGSDSGAASNAAGGNYGVGVTN